MYDMIYVEVYYIMYIYCMNVMLVMSLQICYVILSVSYIISVQNENTIIVPRHEPED